MPSNPSVLAASLGVGHNPVSPLPTKHAQLFCASARFLARLLLRRCLSGRNTTMADLQPPSYREMPMRSRLQSAHLDAHPDAESLYPLQSSRPRLSDICPADRHAAMAAQHLSCLDCTNRAPGTETRLACIQRAPLFRGLAPLTSISIACQALDRVVPRHHTLFRQGEPGRYIFLVASGRAKITRLGPDGDEVILWLKGPGDVMGGLGLAPGTTNESGAESIEPCHIVFWDAHVLKLLTDCSTMLQSNTVRSLAECLDGLQTRFYELATEKVALRLARTLVRLHECVIQGTGEAGRINLSREELAQMTGTTLFAVSRLLSEWTQLGIIDARREAVLVHDAKRLIALAREKPHA